jgi:cytochrome b
MPETFLTFLLLNMMQNVKTESITNDDTTVKVWDLPIRSFHWTLVLGCVAVYLTAKYHFREVHVLIGYGLCFLLAARVFLGFFGSQYSRFSSFIFSPGETLVYVRCMFGRDPKHYFGHNPAGALMVFALLALLTLISFTGLVTLAVIDFEGPLMMLIDYVDDEASYAIRHMHELLTDVGLVLIVLHLMGVIGGSIQHKENLVRAMITGRKISPSQPGAVKWRI